MALLAGAGVAPAATAGVTTLGASHPSGVWALASDGAQVFAWGMASNCAGFVSVHDPVADTHTYANVPVPPLYSTAPGFWDGGHVDTLAPGPCGSGSWTRVTRFDPATNAWSQGAEVPTLLGRYVSMLKDAGDLIVLGGAYYAPNSTVPGSGSGSDPVYATIWRHSFTANLTDSGQLVTPVQPFRLNDDYGLQMVAWQRVDHAYVVAGHSNGTVEVRILDILNATLSPSVALFPSRLQHAQAAWDGCSIYVNGNPPPTGSTGELMAYTPANGTTWRVGQGPDYIGSPVMAGSLYLWGGQGAVRRVDTPVCGYSSDRDRDGVVDGLDNCLAAPNPNQADSDADGQGDACDPAPSPPPSPTPTWTNGTVPHGCPACGATNSTPPDYDQDGVADAFDDCPTIPDPAQADGDADGRGDSCDNCPTDPNGNQADMDGDGVGDACEPVPPAANSTAPAPTNAATTGPGAAPPPPSSSPAASPSTTPAANASAAQAQAGCPGTCQGPGTPARHAPTTATATTVSPAAVAVAAGATAGSALVAAAAYVGRFALSSLTVITTARLRKSSVLTHPQRMALVDLVQTNPGIHHKELQRQTGMARGNLEHHLRIVLAAGHLVEQRSGHLRVFYPPGAADPSLVASAAALRTDRARRLLRALQAGNGPSIAELAKEVGCTYRGAMYHVERLHASGLAELRRDSGVLRAFARSPSS